MKKGYVFLCSKYTEEECLDKNLFGGGKDYSTQARNISIGDYFFLFNYSTRELHGVFTSVSNPGTYDEEAWGGKFPFQVKVKREKDCPPLFISEFDSILLFRNDKGWPKARIRSQNLDKLISKFVSLYRLSEEEKKFQIANPAYNKTDDGHIVRSAAEKKICNWLYKNRIIHCYEILVPIPEPMLCDFCLSIPNSSENLYIEYWGMEDEDYQKRKAEKLAYYKKYNLKLIELFPNDLKNINYILSDKIDEHFS